MTTGIYLSLLRCPSCNSDFKIANNSVFLYCGSCGSGFELIEDNLSAVPVYFAVRGEKPDNFIPFWAFEARLQANKRDAKGFRHGRGLFRLFEEKQVLRFYVAAFLEDLNSTPPVGLQLTYEQPELKFVQRLPQMNGINVSRKSAEKIAEYLIIGSEAEQPDTLRTVDFQLTLERPAIIAISS